MKKKIIVIDDSLTVRQYLSTLLGNAGYETVEAEDGLDGLDKIRSHRDAALVLCDINMPRMNGLDLIEGMNLSNAGTCPPVVIITTEGQAKMLSRARAAGARAWIVKPFDPNHVLMAVRKIAGLP